MVGAGGYFATSGMITGFLEDFLKGTSLSAGFKNYAEPWEDIFKYKAIASSNALNLNYIGIAGNTDSENPKVRSYGTAFVGPLNYTLQSITQTSK
jgi:hypothetical protein